MGMYTHYSLHVEFRKDTPPEIIERIQAQIDGPDDDPDLWPLSRAGAAYQVCAPPRLTRAFADDRWALTVTGSVKYGTGQIMEMVDFLAPHVETYSPRFSGWMQYEEDDHPTLLYVHKGNVKWVETAERDGYPFDGAKRKSTP